MTIDRSDYTWDDATKDLALFTSLTLSQAQTVTWEVRNARVRPYDALPHLTCLFDRDVPQRARALAALLKLTEEPA